MTSSAFQWFELEYAVNKLNSDKDAREWLQNATKRSFREIVHNSNFDLEANENYLDLVSFGIGYVFHEVIAEDTEFKKFSFQAMHLDSCYSEEDAEGRTIRFFRKYEWTPLQIFTKFPDTCPDDIREKAGSPNASTHKEDVIFCVHYREEYANNLNSPKLLDENVRPVGGMYILRKEQHVLGQTGYYEFPVYVPKFRRATKSKEGHGPGIIALPDILTLNQMSELTLKALDKVVDPPSLVTARGLLSDLDLRAGGKTVVRNKDDVTPYMSGANFDAAMLERQQLRDSIKSIFFVDQLELKQAPAMTAEETRIRYELMQRLLGPTLGRIKTDYLDQLVKRTFNTLYRYGVFGEPPESVITEGKGDIDIVFVGPLARAQRSEITQGVTRWVASVAELSGVKENVLDVVNFDALAVGLAELEGVPAEYINSPTDIKETRGEREEQIRQMQEIEMQYAAGKAAEQGAKATQVEDEAGML